MVGGWAGGQARRRIKEAGLDDVPILEFSSTLRAFCGFESRAEQTKFNELMLGASSFGHHGKVRKWCTHYTNCLSRDWL